MRILLTGNDGYIGSVMVPILQASGHEVIGIDTFFFSSQYTIPNSKNTPALHQDIRDFASNGLEGIEAVIHLAALSNDPLCQINPELTFAINHRASIRLARMAKEAGVQRFLYSSTCSVYGVANQEELATEKSTLNPLSPYAVSKVQTEADLSNLADSTFSPVYLRNATAYGWSPHFRSDLVLNNLACWAYTTNEIRILSDGTPWRPIVHVQDIAHAFVAVLVAPREAVHNQAFNVGLNAENYQIRDLADIVQQDFPGCRVTYDENGGPDPRSYRVDFSKITQRLPEFKPVWNARSGVEELHKAYIGIGLTKEEFNGPKYVRIAQLKALIQEGRLDGSLHWKERVTDPQG